MDIWNCYVENKNRDCYRLDAARGRWTSHVKGCLERSLLVTFLASRILMWVLDFFLNISTPALDMFSTLFSVSSFTQLPIKFPSVLLKQSNCCATNTGTFNRIMWTIKMHYFLLIYFNNKPLYVSSRIAAHHQEDQLCINNNWYSYAWCWLAAELSLPMMTSKPARNI